MDRIGIIPPPKTPYLPASETKPSRPTLPVLRDGANTHDSQVHF